MERRKSAREFTREAARLTKDRAHRPSAGISFSPENSSAR